MSAVKEVFLPAIWLAHASSLLPTCLILLVAGRGACATTLILILAGMKGTSLLGRPWKNLSMLVGAMATLLMSRIPTCRMRWAPPQLLRTRRWTRSTGTPWHLLSPLWELVRST